MKKITPCLWFDTQAEDAAKFYTSIFKNSKMGEITRYGEGAPRPANSVLTVTFEIDGQEIMALNAGPEFPFTEAVSLSVNCETQREVDELWQKLTADGGEESMCGWLKDKYGLSWQIVPRQLREMLADDDAAKAKRVMDAMLQMRKIDIAALQHAYDQQ